MQRQIRGLPASRSSPSPKRPLLTPPSRTAAAVVYANGDETAFRTVAEQIARLPLTERIVVLPGPPDGKFPIAKSIPNTVVAYVPGLEDADIGLALGVKLAKSDIVLVLDGSHTVMAEKLAEMMAKIDAGHDVVLSHTEENDRTFAKRSALSHMREFLNATLGREALRSCSFDQLPYALSRHAISSLGPAALVKPPKALAAALLKNLKIEKVHMPRVKRADTYLQADPQWKKTAGDHLEAWKQAMAEQGSRLHFPDLYRNRTVAGGDFS